MRVKTSKSTDFNGRSILQKSFQYRWYPRVSNMQDIAHSFLHAQLHYSNLTRWFPCKDHSSSYVLPDGTTCKKEVTKCSQKGNSQTSFDLDIVKTPTTNLFLERASTRDQIQEKPGRALSSSQFCVRCQLQPSPPLKVSGSKLSYR